MKKKIKNTKADATARKNSKIKVEGDAGYRGKKRMERRDLDRKKEKKEHKGVGRTVVGNELLGQKN